MQNTQATCISGAVDSALADNIMALLGVETMAYIKPVTTQEGPMFGVCAADGTLLATFPTKDAAFFTARQHNLTPVHMQ